MILHEQQSEFEEAIKKMIQNESDVGIKGGAVQALMNIAWDQKEIFCSGRLQKSDY